MGKSVFLTRPTWSTWPGAWLCFHEVITLTAEHSSEQIHAVRVRVCAGKDLSRTIEFEGVPNTGMHRRKCVNRQWPGLNEKSHCPITCLIGATCGWTHKVPDEYATMNTSSTHHWSKERRQQNKTAETSPTTEQMTLATELTTVLPNMQQVLLNSRQTDRSPNDRTERLKQRIQFFFCVNQPKCLFSCKLTRIKQTYTCSWTCCPTNTLYRLIWSSRDACIYVNICIHVCLSEIVLRLSGSKRTKQRWPRKTVENDRVKQLWYPWRRITEHLCHSTNANRVLNRALAPCWKYMHRHRGGGKQQA